MLNMAGCVSEEAVWDALESTGMRQVLYVT